MAEQHHPPWRLELGGNDHVQGHAFAAVTLIEYGDFECPYSRETVTTVHALQREFGDDL